MSRSTVGQEVYPEWRASSLGRMTDKLEHQLLLDMLGEVEGRKILDVGCGDGLFATLLAERGGEVVGVDQDPAMIDAAQARNGAASFLVARGDLLPFPDEAFDVVVMTTVLCLSHCPDKIMDEIGRVLRPGGQLLIGELGKWSLWALHRRLKGFLGNDFWRNAHFHSQADLRRLLEKRPFQITRIEGAVYYPPVLFIARLFAPFNRTFSRWLGTFGAAFIAVSARKTNEA